VHALLLPYFHVSYLFLQNKIINTKIKGVHMTYSSSIAMSRSMTSPVARGQHFASRNQNAIDFRRSGSKLGPISNTVILIVLACLLGLLYLTQVTKTDAYGYTINSLQTKQTQLKQENDDLTLASAQMQSLDRVQSSPEAAALVPLAPSETVNQ
jgi:hypothetical protein